MKIKRYEAKDISTALQLIKSELGPDAIILSTKRITKEGSIRSGGKQTVVEVVAGIDYDPQENLIGKEAEGRQRLSSIPRQTDHEAGEISSLRGEIVGLKTMLQNMAGVPQVKPAKDGVVGELTAYLEAIGMEGSLVCSLLGGIVLDDGNSEESAARLRKIVTERLLEQVVLNASSHYGANGPRIWALVGPTGVGKTATAVKLAASFAITQGKKVALISVDNYRIAASEQLRAYARILGLPCQVILRPEELVRAIKLNRDKDVILIDTAGQNQHDDDHIKEVARFIHSHPDIESKLVLSATTQNGDMEDIFHKYMALSVRACIFSKLDESRFYGPIFNQAVRFRLPISYVTTGQKVPEDIEVASNKTMMHLLWSRLRQN